LLDLPQGMLLTPEALFMRKVEKASECPQICGTYQLMSGRVAGFKLNHELATFIRERTNGPLPRLTAVITHRIIAHEDVSGNG
jgi:hypothetical protein